ncbi:MAG: cytochrome c-type biogenesis protein CcmH [Myxococcota bacterium]
MKGIRAVALGLALLGIVFGAAALRPAGASAADGAMQGEAAPGRAGGAPSAAPSATPSAAGAGSTPSWAYDLAGDLMSPFCPGRTVASCPSPQATELIQWIAMQEAAGATREEVVAMLVAKHGEEILGAPPAKGITLWAYVFPVLGFVAFGGIAALVLRRIVSPAAKGGARPADVAAASGAASGADAAAPPVDRATGSEELARIVDAELAERA